MKRMQYDRAFEWNDKTEGKNCTHTYYTQITTYIDKTAV